MRPGFQKTALRRRRSWLRRIGRRFSRTAGFTLVEASMAMMVAAAFSVMTLSFVGDGLSMLLEAEKLEAAAAAAQLRLSLLRSDPGLKNDRKEGEIGGGVFRGMRYQQIVKEDVIDLAEVQATGELGAPNLDDLAPSGPQNAPARSESAGSSERSATGGRIEVVRIRLTIEYPVGIETGKLIINTLQPSRRVESSN